jgi:hypothetical protein
MEPFACNLIVYRAMLKKRFVDHTKTPPEIQPAAYFLRKNEAHLSVGVGSPNAAIKHFPTSNFGTASLHVGCIRQIESKPEESANLDVIPDEPTQEKPAPDPEHGNIVNVPPYVDASSEDILRAERIAGILAKQSRFVPIPKAG